MKKHARHPLVVAAVTLAVAVAIHALLGMAGAQEGPDWKEGLPRQHKSIWLVHDPDRPKPPPVEPGLHRDAPPSDAIVLFDGTDISSWERHRREGGDAEWKVESGYMEVNDTGSIRTRESFRDCQLHLEYMAPTPPREKSQARGNSGIIFMGLFEVQVLDNRDNATYADGYIGAVYGQHPPIVNAGRKPGEWQTYDIVFRAPRFEGDDLVEPARLTVFLNGVVVQHNAEVYGEVAWRRLAQYGRPREEGPLVLQDHGDKQSVRFRNVWLRKLDLSPEALDNQ